MNRASRPRLSRISGSSYASKLMGRAGDGSTLTLDFTTGQLDPRLTFSRASGGTYTGNDGLVYGMDFATSSSLAIGTGSKSVTLTATAGVDRRYLVGQTVYISNGANNMSGPVTAYNASTQVLTINATATSGSGSFTSWSVGNASARFDYDPTTLSPRGLLIEGTATNLLQQSADWTVSPWSKPAQITWDSTTYATAPDGTNTAKQITVTGGSSASVAQGITNATNRTVSLWLRAGSLTTFSVGAFDSTGGTTWGNNADSTCRIISGPGSVTQQVGGLWSVTGLSTTQWTRVEVFRASSYGALLVYPGGTGTVTGTAFMWGMQMEAGNGASSLIPTGASQVQRLADYCTMPTSSFITGPLYPQTLFVECIPATPSAAFPDIVRLFDRTAGGTFNYGNEIYYFSSATMSVQRKINSSSGTDRALASGLTYNTKHKFATAIDSSSFIGSYDGLTGSGATTAAAALASQVTHLGVGCNGDATPISVMFGTVRQIKFFPFAMAQAQLNALTTL